MYVYVCICVSRKEKVRGNAIERERYTECDVRSLS